MRATLVGMTGALKCTLVCCVSVSAGKRAHVTLMRTFAPLRLTAEGECEHATFTCAFSQTTATLYNFKKTPRSSSQTQLIL